MFITSGLLVIVLKKSKESGIYIHQIKSNKDSFMHNMHNTCYIPN